MALNLAPEFTGELVRRTVFLINAPRTVPAPAAVLEGVQYGNNGTEFTGSLAGATGYPIEDDVRLGITYGQFEGQYEGDLVLPAEADVKLGVDYGADATEFEGELTGGGGGVSRGRVVNP
jgi:hypothetical protein